MKASELRIGNYIADRGNKEWQIDHWESINKLSAKSNATMYMGILMETHPMTEYVDYIKPIPLTEEWLLKFGFEEEAMRYSKNIDLFGGGKKLCFSGDYLYIIDSEKQNTIPTDVVTIWNKDVKKEFYVHQLQNLYFALTGEELIIKQ
jgi:hypothetical protein